MTLAKALSCSVSLVVLATQACTPSTRKGQSNIGDRQAEVLRHAGEYVAPLVEMRDFAGTVLLARSGQIILSRQYGSGLPAAGRPDSMTLYGIDRSRRQ